MFQPQVVPANSMIYAHKIMLLLQLVKYLVGRKKSFLFPVEEGILLVCVSVPFMHFESSIWIVKESRANLERRR